jgi:DNA primase catalytic core
MGRIPKNELERLKAEVDLAELVRGSGVELKRRGKDLVGLCPFHPEQEASFVVSPEKNLFHCLGCGAGGSVIDWVMKTQGVSFRHAVELLREGQAGGSGLRPVKRSTVRRLPPPVELEAADHELLLQVVDFYHRTLKDSAEALAYLARRGLDDPEAIDRFKLGYANRTIGLRLPDSKRKAGREIRGRLVKLGIFRKSGHEHLAGSLTIPVFDPEGRVGELYGRKIHSNLRRGTPRHVYLPGPHRGVWNLGAFRASKEVILCESLIDALTFWCAGYRHVTASYGANGFTPEMLEALKAYGVERVLIAYDRDEAGERGAVELAQNLGAEGISCFRVLFPKGMDANEYALKVTPSRQSLGILLRSAPYMAGPLKTLGAGALLGDGSYPAAVGEPATAELSSLAADEEAPSEPPAPEPAGPLPAAPSSSAAKEPSMAADGEAAEEEAPPPTTGNPQPSTASPVPPPPPANPPVAVGEREVVFRFGERRWRVRGLAGNLSFERLKINLLVAREDRGFFHVDSLDLYSARQRGIFLKQAAEELEVKPDVLKRDLGQVLLKLEALQEEQIRKRLEPKEKVVTIPDTQRQEALKLLEDPRFLDRVVEDLGACGLVGEATNKLAAYLATVSRKLARPLAVMVQSSSAAGKSALMEAVLSFCPEEDRVEYSAMTGQSLFYMGEADLKHKVLAIAEEEGAERASYALKLLQSEGKLSIASTGKDPKTGKLVTHEYRVEGPAAIVLTTTAIDLDDELLNRCMVLAVDESREQTRAIHRLQREDRTLRGLQMRLEKARIVKLHQNAQRLLRPLAVVNPYAGKLTFFDASTRTRRDHLKYLGLIDVIALARQRRREVRSAVVGGRRVRYIEARVEDIELANRLAAEVLGRSLDELPPQTRRLLFLIEEMVRSECERRKIEQRDYRFSRREIRARTSWGDTQLKVHLRRLVDMEYLVVHGARPGTRYGYELVYRGEGKEGERFVLGLLDTTKLEVEIHGYDVNRAGQSGDRAAPGRPPVGPRSGGGRGGASKEGEGDDLRLAAGGPENAYRGPSQTGSSYAQGRRSGMAAAGGK